MKRRDRVTGRIPSWPPDERRAPRVLIESPDSADAWACRRLLERDGFEVLTCTGPETRGISCPIIDGMSCPAASGANAVVSLLPLDDELSRTVIRGLRVRPPAIPVVVEATPQQRARFGETLSGARVVNAPMVGAHLTAAVRDAIRIRVDQRPTGRSNIR